VIVVDASALLETLLRRSAAQAIEDRLLDKSHTLHAPHLLDVEIAQALRRHVAVGDITEQRGREALIDLAGFPIRRYPHGFLLPRIWDLRENITAYDATYVALAELLGATLVTRDRRLAAAPGHQAAIEVV
jgi:predicted nucleic acid-binding protein